MYSWFASSVANSCWFVSMLKLVRQAVVEYVVRLVVAREDLVVLQLLFVRLERERRRVVRVDGDEADVLQVEE